MIYGRTVRGEFMILWVLREYRKDPMHRQLASGRKLVQGKKHQSEDGMQLYLGVQVPQNITHLIGCMVHKVPG